MTNSPPPEPLPYHRLALASARHRWWRPLTGTLVVTGGWIVAILVLGSAASAWGALKGYPETPDGSVEFGPITATAVDLLYLAAAIPVVLLGVRWIGRRPAGTVSSVAGGLRWRLLGVCLLIALPVLAVATGGMLLVPGGDDTGFRWAGWGVFGPSMAMLVVLVPLQSAAEEYVFRGWLMQAAGAFFRSPWFAIVPQAALFAAAHGWGTAWGFAELAFFGVLAGWLTVRTGGLEASIGLHAVNNLLAFGAAAAVVDGLKSDETAADAPWQMAVIDVAAITVYTAVVLWIARRRPPARTAPAPLASPVPGPAPVQPPSLSPVPPRTPFSTLR